MYLYMTCIYGDIPIPIMPFNPLQKGNKVSFTIFPTFMPVNIFRNEPAHDKDKGQSSSKLRY